MIRRVSTCLKVFMAVFLLYFSGLIAFLNGGLPTIQESGALGDVVKWAFYYALFLSGGTTLVIGFALALRRLSRHFPHACLLFLLGVFLLLFLIIRNQSQSIFALHNLLLAGLLTGMFGLCFVLVLFLEKALSEPPR